MDVNYDTARIANRDKFEGSNVFAVGGQHSSESMVIRFPPAARNFAVYLLAESEFAKVANAGIL